MRIGGEQQVPDPDQGSQRHDLHQPVLDWYAESARDLPWRRPDVSPWGVLVSEVMLQQTPVARVEPVWNAWLQRWPRPADLAAEPSGEAVRAWGRLGYPRRALRLHAAAVVISDRHQGAVPADLAQLRELPGVGQYTAAAVAAFAFRIRSTVVDTNVRRVQARTVTGAGAAAPALTAAETALAEELLPADPAAAARWNVAVMELGALVCTARSPACTRCPVADRCRWRAAGHPAYQGPVRPAQRWAGTDRQCRGLLLARVRDEHGDPDRDDTVPPSELALVWDDAVQRERCLSGLLTDGLLERTPDGGYRLPV